MLLCTIATAAGFSAPPGCIEERAFLAASCGNAVKAQRALQTKRDWVQENAGMCGTDIAPFLFSEGFLVPIEGCVDNDGIPVIYSRGVPHGSKMEIARQVSYAYERCLAQCVSSELAQLSAVTIVDVRAASFRFPDGACIGAIRLLSRLYPWTATCKMVFLACPTPVQWCFDRLRPFMSKAQCESIIFAERDELTQYVPEASLPDALGGTSSWSIDSYVEDRCRAEGVGYNGQVREYSGMVVDWAPLDKFDEQRRQRRASSDDKARAATNEGAAIAPTSVASAPAADGDDAPGETESGCEVGPDESLEASGTTDNDTSTAPSWRRRLRNALPFRRASKR